MITITQTCDGCGSERTIKRLDDADYAGWRVVWNQHLCDECIRKALSAGSQSSADIRARLFAIVHHLSPERSRSGYSIAELKQLIYPVIDLIDGAPSQGQEGGR